MKPKSKSRRRRTTVPEIPSQENNVPRHRPKRQIKEVQRFTPADYPSDDDEDNCDDLEQLSDSAFETQDDERMDGSNSSLESFIVSDEDEAEAQLALAAVKSITHRRRPLSVPPVGSESEDGELIYEEEEEEEEDEFDHYYDEELYFEEEDGEFDFDFEYELEEEEWEYAYEVEEEEEEEDV